MSNYLEFNIIGIGKKQLDFSTWRSRKLPVGAPSPSLPCYTPSLALWDWCATLLLPSS